MDITLDQFCKQWLRLGPAAATVSHFDRQIFGFRDIAGRFSKEWLKSFIGSLSFMCFDLADLE